MGVCNVTPDSFSDGGRYFGAEAARARVDELLAEGADLVDVGGESTRPGAAPVAAGEQLTRVLGVVQYAASRGACVTVDTTSAPVAAACLDAGACAVNDVSCLRDVELAKVAAASGAALVLMHSRGTQEAMRGFSKYPDDAYGDVVADVCREWTAAADRAREAGVTELVMDPGLGFAKNARQSMELLRRTNELVDTLAVPVAIGASRKSFLTLVDPGAPPGERLGASLAAAIDAMRKGAAILRVHDVRATAQALDLTRSLAGKAP
ncbi:MAG TPA: dihydropteroate synthase [Polyangiaceae bacterium]|jgi:dihydropteroate synthase